MTNKNRTQAVIDLNAIASNTRAVKAHIKEQMLCAVLKADAYGHGAKELAPVCLNNGASSIAVATFEEAAELRHSGIESPILILGYTPEPLLKDVLNLGLTQTIFSQDCARALVNAAKETSKKAKAHIKVDTGMGRLGFLPDNDSVKIITEILNTPELETQGIYTHYATADEPDNSFVTEQASRFDSFLKQLSKHSALPRIIHAANSGAVINYPGLSRDMSRVGITLYGLAPKNFGDTGTLKLTPAMSLVSQISSVKSVDKHTSISYGQSYYTSRPSVIAAVPVGYADGYPRGLSNKANVIVNGKLAPVIGNICMDITIIDITGINAAPGDEVVLMGRSGGHCISADTLADLTGTINYEIICQISKRVPRIYI